MDVDGVDPDDADDDAGNGLPTRRGPRLPNDPLKYIRGVKGGRYQARPYDAIDRTRLNLGIFSTVGEARSAILAHFWGRLPAPPKYVEKIVKDGQTFYIAVVPVCGFRTRIGSPMRTPERASKIVREFLTCFYGEARAGEMISGKTDGASISPRLRARKRTGAA